MDYRKLYIKYKNKYINLKNNLKGGDNGTPVKFIGKFNDDKNKFTGTVTYNDIIDNTTKDFEGQWIPGESIDSGMETDKSLKYSFIDTISNKNNISHFIFYPDTSYDIWSTAGDKFKAIGKIKQMTDEEIIKHSIGIIFNDNIKNLNNNKIKFEQGKFNDKLTLDYNITYNTASAYDYREKKISFINKEMSIDIVHLTNIEQYFTILKINTESMLLLLNMLLILIYKNILTITKEDIDKIKSLLTQQEFKDIGNLVPCVISLFQII